MDHLLTACACGLDPASEAMAVQAGLAVVISVPFWFRAQIANAVSRLRGLTGTPEAETCAVPPEDEAHAG